MPKSCPSSVICHSIFNIRSVSSFDVRYSLFVIRNSTFALSDALNNDSDPYCRLRPGTPSGAGTAEPPNAFSLRYSRTVEQSNALRENDD
jgi:hypothetical protein